MAKIKVENTEITVVSVQNEDYISLTDMAHSQMQEQFLTLVSKDDRIFVKVHFPNVEDFNDYTLAVQPEESGLFVFYHIYKRKSTYDITRFFDRTKILSLKSGNAIIERLDIDKEDGAVSDIINKI